MSSTTSSTSRSCWRSRRSARRRPPSPRCWPSRPPSCAPKTRGVCATDASLRVRLQVWDHNTWREEGESRL
ncbi:hypothetical protein Y1Q_0013838 [Alligator mississippiensis]|uniref:Uncharacterized protein n=1 Tax=Alligator mississippiensis TaxID=8496 RepID=A0A151NG48_ALLMI|nr:hypothetical protein Y1Q_0013838 [Alligator mississippiensis]